MHQQLINSTFQILSPCPSCSAQLCWSTKDFFFPFFLTRLRFTSLLSSPPRSPPLLPSSFSSILYTQWVVEMYVIFHSQNLWYTGTRCQFHSLTRALSSSYHRVPNLMLNVSFLPRFCSPVPLLTPFSTR